MFEHKGYTGAITTTDTEAGCFHGRIAGIQDVVTFEGKTVPELLAAFRESVEDYLAFCAERKDSPEKPFSGKFVVRLSPELHRQASDAAGHEQISLNAWMVAAVEQRLIQAGPRHSTLSFDEMENLAQCVAAILDTKPRPPSRPNKHPSDTIHSGSTRQRQGRKALK